MRGSPLRECEKCGTVDPPYWLPHFKDREKDVCHLDDFARIEPGLYQKLLVERGTVIRGVYAYKISGGKVVLRLWLPLYKARKNSFRQVVGYFDGATLEYAWRRDARRDPAQTKLDAVFAASIVKPVRTKKTKKHRIPDRNGKRRGVSYHRVPPQVTLPPTSYNQGSGKRVKD